MVQLSKETGGKQMKKLSIILALLLVVCFVSGAIAEDRLKWSGAYRARAFYKDNLDDFNDDDNSDRQYYVDQRFRVQMRLGIADGIDGTLRMDFSEAQWGQGTTGSRNWARATHDNNMLQVDRAYVRINKEMFTLVVGQQFMALGKSMIWDSQQFGVNVRVKLPVDLYGQWAKIDENGALTDEAFNNSEDVDFWGGQAVYTQEGWKVGIHAATIQDNEETDDSPYVFGIQGDATWGAFMLQGEADFFGGDAGGGNDYMGSQIWLGGKYTVTPAFWMGLDAWYAASTSDATETQITGLGGVQSWNMSEIGPFNADLLVLSGIAGAVGGVAKNHAEFDPAGTNSGAVGGVLSAGYRVIEPLELTGALLWVSPESTSNTILNSAFTGNIFLNYDWYENTQVAAGYIYTSIDADGGSTDGAHLLALRLQLKF
jgi:hypothetical protein